MMEDRLVMIKAVAVIFTVVAIMSITLNVMCIYNRHNMLNAAMSGNYTVYYNGEEVDPTKLNLYGYAYAIDEEKHEIYLSNPRPVVRHMYTVPVVR